MSFSYNAEGGFLLSSDLVTIKRMGERLVAEYGDGVYEITQEDSISKPIPLN